MHSEAEKLHNLIKLENHSPSSLRLQSKTNFFDLNNFLLASRAKRRREREKKISKRDRMTVNYNRSEEKNMKTFPSTHGILVLIEEQ